MKFHLSLSEQPAARQPGLAMVDDGNTGSDSTAGLESPVRDRFLRSLNCLHPFHIPFELCVFPGHCAGSRKDCENSARMRIVSERNWWQPFQKSWLRRWCVVVEQGDGHLRNLWNCWSNCEELSRSLVWQRFPAFWRWQKIFATQRGVFWLRKENEMSTCGCFYQGL